MQRFDDWARRWFARCGTMAQRLQRSDFWPDATHESGAWIERRLAYGIKARVGSYTSTGVVPTPAIAYLTPRLGYSAGMVISASHNPFEDNGIKVFSGTGEKFTETLEREVEAIVTDPSWSVPDRRRPHRPCRHHRRLSRSLARMLPAAALARLRIAIDCANGATTSVAPRLFRELGST